MLLMAVGGGLFNRILVEYSPDVVAAYQVGGRLDHVVLLPMISISTALVTLVAMFRGAQRLDLVRDVVSYAMRWSIAIGAVTALLFFALAPEMVRGFSDEPGIVAAGTTYLRIIAWGYPFTAISMLAGRILQGLGIGTPVLVLTVMRILLIAAPLSWALVYWFDSPVEGVWGGDPLRQRGDRGGRRSSGCGRGSARSGARRARRGCVRAAPRRAAGRSRSGLRPRRPPPRRDLSSRIDAGHQRRGLRRGRGRRRQRGAVRGDRRA